LLAEKQLTMSKSFCIIHIEDGHIENTASFTKFLRNLKDGKHILEASPYNKRSIPQNRYLHGVLIPEFRKALNSVGYDEVKDDAQAKEIMKAMFLKRRVVNKETGEVLEYTQRTRDLTKEETTILIDEVIKFTAENMNYQIAYPNEQTFLSYGD
jgi:hypothetical protein